MSDPEKQQQNPDPPQGSRPTSGERSAAGFRQASKAGRDSARGSNGDDRWETASLFRHIADTAPVMIWLAGLDKMCFWFNKPWMDFTGRTMEEEYGNGWVEGVHPEDVERCMDTYVSSFEARESFKMEYRLRRHDGEYRWLLDHGVPCYAQNGEFIGYTGSCVDITGRKQAEDKLRESEENLTALVEATSQVVWRTDDGGMDEQTEQFWGELTGQTAEQAADWGWLNAIHPADREGVRAAWEQALRDNTHFEAHYRVLNRGGEYQHFKVYGVPVLNRDGSFRVWIGTMRDITERVGADQALRSSEARLRMLVESATEFAILTLGEDCRIKSWSEGAERIFGYREEEILGKSFSILFLPEERAAGVPQRELKTAQEQGYAVDERWHVRKDGSVFFASGAASPIRGSDPLEFVKIARDLTHRKEMEEALKDADRRKNEFLATLAHELRNPLAPIRSGLDLLNRAGYDRRLIHRTLKVIERQTDQIVHLVDDLLDISRITQGKIKLKKERVDLISLVKLAVEGSSGLLRSKRHQLSVSLPDQPVYLNADFTRIEQVILNLLNNAIKYTPSGGKLSISVTTRSEGQAVVKVKDSGIGIPSSKLNEVFEIFTQVDETAEEAHCGLGIGLSVVRGLVEMHGGTVTANSSGPGKGSEFIVCLPLCPEGVPELPIADPVELELSDTGAGTPTNGKRVLVVDDNRDAVAMLQILLTMEGHDVRAAYDGEAAVREAEEFRPHVCLCDLGLPKIDGFEVARRVSASVPETLLVSVSGWGQDEDRQRSREAGFVHHLVKPVKIDDVTELLH